MKRGAKAIPLEDKIARGTRRKDRDDHKGPTLAVSNDGPVMPSYMMDDSNPLAIIARSVWQDLHPKITALGIGDLDVNLFTRYCFLEADVRATMSTGVMPGMAKMTQLRQMEELLRIAGPKSRVTVKQGGPEANPFQRNGKRG